MKNLVFGVFVLSLLIVSCAKKTPTDFYPADSAKASYDTIAKDSFSNGATSIDIVRQIRMSSQKYRDSVKEALKAQAEEKRIQAELEKENKKKLDDEKKKTEEEKKLKKASEKPVTQEQTH